ncbi:ABC transporter related protein [Acidianus hospitalis W1]|uniref:ABC transporter related protein n=1 Tax=Acidianus hospitalis (strain W1) TaxID=933801 RepID=F4B6W5_ACIHW|nr:ABC transporter related protein [Acidianus hospitalis W1]
MNTLVDYENIFIGKPKGIKVLQAIDVSKRYQKDYVLRNVNLELEQGRLGIIGLHDSGKTVLMRLLSGLEKPSSGKITLDGRKLDRRKIAYVPQAPLFDPLLKAKEVMRYVGSEEYLDVVDLEREKKVKDMSLGEKKRLALALSLPFTPEYLLIDDITEDSKEFFLEFIKNFRGGVIISYHNFRDVWEVIDDVIILSKGRVTYKGNKEGLKFKIIRTKALNIPLDRVVREGDYVEIWEEFDDNFVEEKLKALGINYEVKEASPDEVFQRFYA